MVPSYGAMRSAQHQVVLGVPLRVPRCIPRASTPLDEHGRMSEEGGAADEQHRPKASPRLLPTFPENKLAT